MKRALNVRPVQAAKGISRRLQQRILQDMRSLYNNLDELYLQDPDGYDNLDVAALHSELDQLLPYVAGEVEGRPE